MVHFLQGLALGVIMAGFLVGYLYSTGSKLIWKSKGK